jgi:hypothetical protein
VCRGRSRSRSGERKGDDHRGGEAPAPIGHDTQRSAASTKTRSASSASQSR